jgi:hypothetical protein
MKPKEEIEQLANQWSDDYEKGANRDIAKRSYIAGYTQCQEDMADKKYTEEDMRQSFMAGVDCENGNGKNFNQFINSLNKQD